MLRKEGFRYHPDLVIAYVAHYSSHRHIRKRSFGREKPVFLLQDGQLVLENSPVASPGWKDTMVSGLQRHSVLGRLRVRRALAKVTSGFESFSTEALSTEEKQDVFRRGEEIVVAMHKESRAQSVPFVLISQIPELTEGVRSRGVATYDATEALQNAKLTLPAPLAHINESGNGILAWELARYLKQNELIPRPYWPKKAKGNEEL